MGHTVRLALWVHQLSSYPISVRDSNCSTCDVTLHCGLPDQLVLHHSIKLLFWFLFFPSCLSKFATWACRSWTCAHRDLITAISWWLLAAPRRAEASAAPNTVQTTTVPSLSLDFVFNGKAVMWSITLCTLCPCSAAHSSWDTDWSPPHLSVSQC